MNKEKTIMPTYKTIKENAIYYYEQYELEKKQFNEMVYDKGNQIITDFVIYDENESVKWNKEQAELHNIEVKTKLEKQKEKMDDCYEKFEDTLLEYLTAYDEDITKDKYHKIKYFMYEWNKSTYDMENGVDNYICFFVDFLRIAGKPPHVSSWND